MRLFCLLLSLFCVLTLSACGTEDETIPPTFSDIKVNGEDVSSSYTVSTVTITGIIDDPAATLVVTTSVSSEVLVVVASDGSWSFPVTLQAGANLISFIASDKNGNLNQLVLNLFYDPPFPIDAVI